MYRYFLSLLIVSILFSSVSAQEVPWQTLTVPSTALNIDQPIQVYLPEGYESSEKSYPVFYVIDAHWYFFNGVSIQKTLRGDGILPKMIVVGIDFQHRPYRDSLFNASWDAVVNFIGNELPSYIGQNYRTKERIIFGWEQASFMVSELLFREDPTFDGYIISNGGYLTDEMITAFRQSNGQEKYAFISNSDKDIYTIDHTLRMVETLESNTFENLNWTYEPIHSEVHETLAYQSMYFGLKHFYHNYPSLVYSSTTEFEEKGGMTYLESYFQGRGERFGLDPEIDASTKNSLIWLAWKRDEFPAFKNFMTLFSDVLTSRRYASSYWQHRLGQFYLKYEDHKPAIDHFNKGINEFPDDQYMAAMYAGLGKAYQATNNRKLAKANFQKAIDFARKQSDPKLADYQLLLDEM